MAIALMILLVGVLLFAAYAIGEVRIYRQGGDVYEWTKKLSKILPK